MKVAIYVRESGTRKCKPASPRAMYPANVTFCLRYTLGGKRRWEQLSVSTYKEAQTESLGRLGDLITEKCQENSKSVRRSARTSHCPCRVPVQSRRPSPRPVS
jgi:hypothetical protein